MLRRSRQRAPNLRVGDRLLCGFGALFLSPGRIRKVAIGLRPSTLLTFHQALVRGKYRRLFSSSARPKKPGPKGPSESLIRAIVELKSRNPRFGCPRIARIISQTFGVDIDKNVVHRVLAKRSRPAPGGTGPSWLSFVGHTTDSLWSVDLLRCASIVLQSDWVLVVMDQFTRRPDDEFETDTSCWQSYRMPSYRGYRFPPALVHNSRSRSIIALHPEIRGPA